ncbi:MAG: putative DNA-binding domain-containing protein [Elusimicrobiota bacterium]
MSDSPLEALQRRFVRSITFMSDPEFVASVTGGGSLTAAEAVEVYRRGYPARLTDALGETYETCWRVLGDEAFFDAARAYISRFPSRTHNLSDYGAEFPEFLESLPIAEDAPYLGDLARYAWTFKELFHTKPHEGLDPAVLAAKAHPDAVLRLGAAVRLLSLRHRVYGIFRRDNEDDTPIQDAAWEGAERLVLYKKEGNQIFVRELTIPEHAALAALAAGRPLADALASAEGLDAAAAQELFGFISVAGIVSRVE